MKDLDVSSVAQGVRIVACLTLLATAPLARAHAQEEQEDQKAAEPSPARVHMPDGQLKSHSIRVYVNREIQPSQEPKLQLLRAHVVSEKTEAEKEKLEPRVVAPGQEWIESVDGQEVRRTGTLLMFDLGKMKFGYKGTLRVTPIVSWTEGEATHLAVGTGEVNVANIVGIAAWALVVVVAGVGLVILLAARGGGSPARFLIGAHGHLSLAQAQIACWTIAIGGIVLGYGFVRLQIPEIPTSLLALMGASLTTGGVAFFKDDERARAAPPASVAASVAATGAGPPLVAGDLVRAFTPGQPPVLSLAKAQMLFWTVLLLVLFISKSVLDGAIWAVPWPLVGLMGFSQAGYLAPKLAPKP